MSDKIKTYTVRPSGISYLLPDGRAGTITDPAALRTFYQRIYNHEAITKEEDGQAGRRYARRLSPWSGPQRPAGP